MREARSLVPITVGVARVLTSTCHSTRTCPAWAEVLLLVEEVSRTAGHRLGASRAENLPVALDRAYEQTVAWTTFSKAEVKVTEASDNMSGRSFVVTGAAGGLGSGTLEALVARQPNAKFALLDRDEAGLEETAARVKSAGGTALCYPTDVTRSSDVDEAIRSAALDLGGLDGLVACAGVRMQNARIDQISDAVWNEIFSVNVSGVFNSLRAFARVMIDSKRAGSVVAISSLSGTRGRLGQGAYCASKAAVSHLARVAALDLAQHNVRVNVVAPGTVDTPMLAKAREQEGPEISDKRLFGDADLLRPGIPSRRFASVDDVTNVILFLLSDQSAHITGQVVVIDGGESVL